MTNEELFDKYLSDTLTANEEEKLYDLLKDDEHGQHLVEYSLEMFTNTKTASDLLKGNTSKERKELVKQHQETIPITKYLALASAVAAVILLSFWLSRPVPKESTEISRIGEKANVIHGGTFQLGDTIKTEKPTHFEFMDGSKIKLNGEVVVESEKLIFLKSGTIHINAVPQENEKLTVKTENAMASVLGTSFTLRRLHSETALTVSEGKVHFKYEGGEKTATGGESLITYRDRVITSKKGLEHAKFQVYKQMLSEDASLRLFVPLENHDPLHAFQFPKESCKLVLGNLTKGRKPFTRSLNNGALEVKGTENFDLKMPCTIGAWVNISSFENYPPIITKGDDAWRLQMNVNGKRVHFGFGDNKQFINGKKFLEAGKWYFIIVTGDGNKVRVYVNGRLENEKAIESYSFENDSTIMIGGNKTVPERNFSGLIGSSFILQRALSESQVNSLYHWAK